MPKRRGENTLEGGSNKKQKAGDDEHDIAGTYIMLVSNPFYFLFLLFLLFNFCCNFLFGRVAFFLVITFFSLMYSYPHLLIFCIACCTH